MPGPPPKRSSQRRRKNKSPEVTKVVGGTSALRDGEPPRSGEGSGVAAWREYAARLGYHVPARATRAQIIAIIDERSGGEDADWHELARDWYRSLADSGQSIYYQSSDWQTARIWAELLSKQLFSSRPSAQMIQAWQSAAADLLTTEGARRRVRVEIERDQADSPDEVSEVAQLDEFRRRASS
jgi:hypothetical protein